MRLDVRVARLSEVAVGRPANEAALPRGIEPSARLAGRDDRHRLLDRRLMFATRTASAAATMPPSIPPVLCELPARTRGSVLATSILSQIGSAIGPAIRSPVGSAIRASI